MRVAHRDLNALMRTELDMFLDEVDDVDLTVEQGGVGVPDRMLSVDFSFDDTSFVVETPFGRIQLSKGLLRAESVSASELLRWVKYAIRQAVIRREASFLHAAAVSGDGQAYLFPAWGHTGKTNVILSFLLGGYDYMSDDWCFVTAPGEVLSYPRHLELFEYNLECYPFLVAALESQSDQKHLKRHMAATRVARSLNKSNWLSRLLGRWLSDRYFVSVRVPVSRAIPGCRTVMRSSLSKVCLLTTARSGVGVVSEVPPGELARKIALFGQYERSRFHRSQLALAYAGLKELEDDYLSAETDLLRRAFEGAKCLEATIPTTLRSRDVDRIRGLVEGA